MLKIARLVCPKTGDVLDNHLIREDGKILCLLGKRTRRAPYFIHGGINKKGYVRVDIAVNGKLYRIPLHRAVLSSFLGTNSLPCNHINGNKSDNWLENLEYVTCKEHSRHTIYQLKRDLGSKKIMLSEMKQAISMRKDGVPYYKIAKVLGVSKSSVMYVLKEKSLRRKRYAERDQI